MKPGWLYRITVSEERSIDTKALVSAAKQMGGFEGLKFIWAPHPLAFTPHYKRKTLKNVEDVSQENLDAARKMPQYMLDFRDLLPNSMRIGGAEDDESGAMDE